MKKTLIFTVLLTFMFSSVNLFSQADDKRLEEVKKAAKKDAGDKTWIKGGGLGLDFAGLLMKNPKVGAGDNKIGFGGLTSIFANYKKGKIVWDNSGSIQLAIQKLGTKEFEKSLDVLRLNSRAGYQIKDKIYGALDVDLTTQLTPTYTGNKLSPAPIDIIQSNFLSPLWLNISPGIDYKYSDNLSLFLSPASLKYLYIGNQDIANLGVHGTKIKDNSTEYNKSFTQLGARLTAKYNNKFFTEKVVYSSVLDIFSNYLSNPQNLDFLWKNDIGFVVFDKISFNILYEASYDDDINVRVDRNENGEYEEGELGKRVNHVGALMIKYNYIF